MLYPAAQQQQHRNGLYQPCDRFKIKLSARVKADEAAVLRTFLQTAPLPPRPICLARVVGVSPGCKGLVAAQQLHPSQAALLLPPYNTLSVPVARTAAAEGSSADDRVYQWECSWLQAFERIHGPLPPVLVDYLVQQGEACLDVGKVDVGGTYQLTALLLYVLQLAAAATAAGQRSFWADWLQLLPSLGQGTAPFGTWSDTELAALHFEPYKAAMSASNAATRMLCQQLLGHFHIQLPGLCLADTVEAVSAALYHVKTRSITVDGCLALLPVHDFINHADSPNCLVSHHHMQGWHAVVPLTPIAPGTELTINYNQNPCSNLDTLLAWGFTGRPSALDPGLPLAYRALPAVPAQLVAAAAAAAVLGGQGQQGAALQLQDAGSDCAAAAGVLVGDSQGADQLQLQEDCQAQLLAAAASLPLSDWGAATAAAAAAGSVKVHVDAQHAEAAGLFSRQGIWSLLPWLPKAVGPGRQGYVQQRQQTAAAGLGASEAAAAAADAAAAAAAASTYDMYVSSSRERQRARLAALEGILAAAVEHVQAGTHAADTAGAAASTPAVAESTTDLWSQQQQLQLLSVRVCRAAAQLQLLCACLTSQELQAVQQELVGHDLQLEHRASSASSSPAGAAAGDEQGGRVTQPGAGIKADIGIGVSGPASRQQVIRVHLVPALQLQQSLAAQLVVLQASSIVAGAEASTHTATGPVRAAAAEVLRSATARQGSGLLCTELPSETEQQQELLTQLHTLQQRQHEHLTVGTKLLGEAVDMSAAMAVNTGVGAGAKAGTGGGSRVAVAAATNSIQRGLLQQCDALLQRVEDSIAQQVVRV